MWWTKALHCFPEEFQCSVAIPALRNVAFQHFAFVIHSPPKVVRLVVDSHENLVQMPLPIRTSAQLLNAFLSDPGSRQRDETVLPETDRLMADINTAFVQQILDITK